MRSDTKILIVEDNELLALYFEKVLTNSGYDIIGVVDSFEQYNALEKKENPNLVLMDISLKDGESGVDMAEILKQQFDSKYIYITSYEDPGLRGDALRTEPQAILTKFMSEETLCYLIDNLKLVS